MAKIVIAGDAVVVKSELKLEDIKTIAKYEPKALTLMGGEDGKEPIFAVGLTTDAGDININGASFGKADADGKATITMVMQGVPTEKAKDWVADRLGSAIMHLNALEAKLPEVLSGISAKRAAVMEGIEVAG
jgi:hypothetical protein